MPPLDLASLVFAILALTLAGFSKGVIGLGLPTIGVGLLGVLMPPAQAAAILALPNLVTNAWQYASGPEPTRILRRLAPMLAGICAGTAAAALVMPAGPGKLGTALLGLALIIYAGLGLASVKLTVPPEAEAWAGALAGALTGAVTVATGVFVIPAVPYLQAIGLEKDELVQALGLSFLVSTVTLAAALFSGGLLDAAVAAWSAAALAPVACGMALGQAIRSRISAASFRRWFFLALLGLGAYLIARSVG